MRPGSFSSVLLVISLLLLGFYLLLGQHPDEARTAMNGYPAKESAVLKPSFRQSIYSIAPYFSSLAEAPIKGEIRFVEITNEKSFYIYLPPNHAASDEHFPTLYHLHGAGVREKWVKHDIHWIATEHEKAVKMGVSVPMIIVGPLDKSKFSMWADSKDGTNKMATLVTSDVRNYVETHYKASQDRASRFIQGFSMGGFGAAMLGLKYQDLYATITILDGAMHDWRTLNLGRSTIATNQFDDDEAYFKEWSPWEWVQRADLSQTPIFIIEGLMVDYNTRYFDYLKRHGARVRKVSPPCMHDVKCLEESYGVQMFEFMNTHGNAVDSLVSN